MSTAPTWMRWRLVGLLVAISFMTWFNRVSMAVAYDTTIGERYGVSEEAIGTVYSAFFLSYLVFMTPGGWFIDRFGPKLALVIMGLGSGFFGALTGLAGLPAVVAAGGMVAALLVTRFAMGLVTAPIYPAASRMVAWWVPWRERAFTNGLIQAAAAVGMACAFPLFGALVDLWDWPLAFLASGSFTFLIGIVWLIYAADRPFALSVDTPAAVEKSLEATETGVVAGMPAKAMETGVKAGAPPGGSESGFMAGKPPMPTLVLESPSWWSPLRNRNVLLLTISYAAIGYLEYLFFFWMNHYFDKILKIPKEQSRIYTAILLLSLGLGMVIGGWAADRLRRSFFGPWVGFAMVPMAGMALGAIALGMGVLGNTIMEIVVWLGLAMFAVGATEAPTWTAAVELGGRQGGTAAAIVNTGGNLGGFIAPFLTPIISHAVRDVFGVSEQAGWQWGISLAGVFCLSGAVLWWWIRPQQQDSNV